MDGRGIKIELIISGVNEVRDISFMWGNLWIFRNKKVFLFVWDNSFFLSLFGNFEMWRKVFWLGRSIV